VLFISGVLWAVGLVCVACKVVFYAVVYCKIFALRWFGRIMWCEFTSWNV